MAADTSSQIEPEPIEAEFEPASEPVDNDAAARTRPPPRLRSRAVSFTELIIGCSAAALLGAVAAIGLSSNNSGATTGTLAREIDTLVQRQSEMTARLEQASDDLVTIRARQETHAGRLAQRETGEAALRTELAVIAGQMAALVSDNPAEASPAADASATALGVLLARIDRLERTLAEDAAAPRTTRQTQRAVTDLIEQIAALDEANAQLSAALASRQAALATVEAGLARVSAELDVVRGRQNEMQQQRAGIGAAYSPGAQITDMRPAAASVPAVGVSRAASAFYALENAAQGGRPFVSQQQVLASLLPTDTDVAALRDIARHGAPTTEQLRRDFVSAARAVEIITGAGTGDRWRWLRKGLPRDAMARSGQPDARVTAALAQAGRALDLGDLRGAAQAMDSLTDIGGDVFQTWRDQAIRRADLNDRLAALQARLAANGLAQSEG